MVNSKNWHSGTSLLLTLGMTLATATPGLMSKQAMAQFNGPRQYPGYQQRQYPGYQQRRYPGYQHRRYPGNPRGPLSVARIRAGKLIPIENKEAEMVVITPD